MVLAFADDLFLHGHHLPRWVTDYVDIEESLAVGSIAQEELAHAAALYELAGISTTERDWWIFERPVEQWHPSRLTVPPVDDWAMAVARGFLFTAAVQIFLSQLQRAAEHIRAVAAVMAAEQDLHRMHWDRWVTILSRDKDTADVFSDALTAMAGRSGDLFGEPAWRHDQALAVEAPLDLQAAHDMWVRSVHARLRALRGPEISLAALPSPRLPGGDPGALAEVLRGVRAVRSAYPDRVYPVHG
jgi:1,2-phenylacetyl-CoA epoxidase catalytic subunit